MADINKVIVIDVENKASQDLTQVGNDIEQIGNKTQGSINELKALKKELRNTAAGSEEFKKLYNQIDDLEEKIKGTKKASSDWVDSIASMPGPLGSLGKAINSVKEGTVSFTGALKATGIGLIVAALGGLVAAFSSNERAMKKLQPLLNGLEKILGGIFAAVEPLFDAFLDLAMTALPYVTKGIGIFYSSLVGLFTLVKEAGIGYIKMMKGVLTLDFDTATEGFNQLKDSFSKAVKSGEDAYKRFQAGSKEMTKSEKEEAEKRQKDADQAAAKKKAAGEKAAADEAKRLDAIKQLNEDYIKQLKDLDATTEEEKLALQRQRADAELTKLGATKQEKLAMNAYYNRLEQDLEKEHQTKLEGITKEYQDKLAGLKAVTDQQKLDLELKKQQEDEDKAIAAVEKEGKNEEDKLKAVQAIRDYYKQLEDTTKTNFQLSQDEKDKLTKQKKLDEEKVFNDQLIETENAYQAAKRSALDTGLEILMMFAGKNKAIALSILAIQKGLAIADIVVGAAKSISVATGALALANQGALATPQAIATSGASAVPVIAANTALYAKGVATTKISAAVGIASILAAGIGQAASIASGSGGGAGGGASPGGGGAAPAPQAQFNIVGQSSTNQLAGTIAGAQQQPVQAFVVGSDVTTQQALDRQKINNSTFL